MEITRVFYAFAVTAFYGVKIAFSKKEVNRSAIKMAWARSVLNGFNIRVETIGASPDSRPCILVGNHVGFLDILVILSVYPCAVFIAKQDLKNWPIIGQAAKAAGTIFVDRDARSARKQLRNEILENLKTRGSSLVVFPSGTSTLDESRPWKKGIFEIAKAYTIPVKLFRLDYDPLRVCAYVGEDQLLSQMLSLSRAVQKSVKLTWLKQYDVSDEPKIFAERLRQEVIAHA